MKVQMQALINVSMFDGAPPNGLAFSCRERAADHLQRADDLAREAVNCNAVLGLRWWAIQRPLSSFLRYAID